MSSRAFIFLGLLFVVVILLSSEEVTAITARDVKFMKEAMMETDEVEDVKRHGFGGGQAISVANVCLNRCAHGCCGCVRSRCIRCC
ncbi:unnamed protein product [Citrullus colocynthis]|uniref:Uncharacterized protein n=1 Tax=Citrullus colocynthis TaxID=252529 RepID=A0ABP0YAM5_9ROSI